MTSPCDGICSCILFASRAFLQIPAGLFFSKPSNSDRAQNCPGDSARIWGPAQPGRDGVEGHVDAPLFPGMVCLAFYFNFLFAEPLLPSPTLADVPVLCFEIPLAPSILDYRTLKASSPGLPRAQANMPSAIQRSTATQGPQLTPRPTC